MPDLITNNILVVGMHRSGTSAVTGILQEHGYYLGNVNNKSKDNLKGNKEVPLIWQFNERLLRSNGGSWFNPPSKIKLNPFHRNFIDFLLQTYDQHSPWAIKDPRLTLLLSHYLLKRTNEIVVAVFRHPSLVIKSLKARNKMAFTEAEELWHHYNSKLLDLKNQKNVFFIEFNEQFRANIAAVLSDIGHTNFNDNFYDDKLVHNNSVNLEAYKLKPKSVHLFEQLQSMVYTRK